MRKNIKNYFRLTDLTNDHGFTLIEVLTAMSIFAIVGLATVAIMQKAVAARFAVRQKSEVLIQSSAAWLLLKSDLRSIRAFRLNSFRGHSDSLRFTASYCNANGQVRYRFISYYFETAPDYSAKNLMRTSTNLDGKQKTKQLLSNVKSLRFSYLQNQTAIWTDSWSASDELPLAVRIEMATAFAGEIEEIIYPIRTSGKFNSNETEN
ncbi:MAG: type II secretion system protein GspJ [bacterium]